MIEEKVIILDFGSQYTQLIARRVRELKVFSEIKPCYTEFSSDLLSKVKAIILSGGPSSVTGPDAPKFDEAWLDTGLPTLGICYGMQLMALHAGAKLESGKKREYGRAKIKIENDSLLFKEISKETDVWMSHGDHVEDNPSSFTVCASSENIHVAAIENIDKKYYGLQFHPEVVHSAEGTQVIRNFLFKISNFNQSWTSSHFISDAVEEIKSVVNDTSNVICGLSGGVDSSVAAVLVNKAIGDRLHCIFVDNGLVRKNEAKSVEKMLGKDGLGLNLTCVDASERFLSELEGVTDPEQKRKIIGRVFIEVFDDEAKKIKNVSHLVQGTLYPDVIESVSVRGPSATIKTHHNVGGLPEQMNLELIEPFRELFKDEVREIGSELGLSDEIIQRQPFPGPGLAVRILGEITRDRLEVLREADEIFIDAVRKNGFYTKLWQSFAVLLPIKTVGVMGDNRTYEDVIALRAVSSKDGMTADWEYLPQELLSKVSNRIINEIPGVNRVVLDISSKPPATIEWE